IALTAAELWLKRSGRDREVVGRQIIRRHTRHVSVAGCIQRDAVSTVSRAAAQVGRIDQRGAVWIQLGHEAVPRTPESWLEASWRRRKVLCSTPPDHIGIASRVHGEIKARIPIAAAEVGAVDELALNIELRHEGVVEAAAVGPLESSRRG